jgi:hypothetical protein
MRLEHTTLGKMFLTKVAKKNVAHVFVQYAFLNSRHISDNYTNESVSQLFHYAYISKLASVAINNCHTHARPHMKMIKALYYH